ncbi:MAG: glycosyltransferase, partial [Actinomycetota bacterium]
MRDRGHEIGWYAGPRYAAKVESLGLPVHPYRRATEVMAEEINDLYPERAKLRGPKRLSFDVEKFFIANVEHNYLDIRDLRHSFPFDILLCDGAFYAERLVHHALGVPVMAVALSTVLPSPEGPPPFFGLRPARNPLDRLVHSVVRKMVASTNKAAVTAYNAVLARYGVPPISADGFPDQPVRELTRIFLNASPGLEFPSYRPPAGAEWVGPLLPARRDSARRPYNLPGNITDAKRKVVAVSQGTVDKTHTSKLIEPRLAALRDGPYVVVATTGGSRTEELRTRYSAPNVVIEDFIDYDV